MESFWWCLFSVVDELMMIMMTKYARFSINETFQSLTILKFWTCIVYIGHNTIIIHEQLSNSSIIFFACNFNHLPVPMATYQPVKLHTTSMNKSGQSRARLDLVIRKVISGFVAADTLGLGQIVFFLSLRNCTWLGLLKILLSALAYRELKRF